MALLQSSPRIGIIGAGIIGLSAAYELAVHRGARVTIFDVGAPGRGASWAAAGMLAPAFEAAADGRVHPGLFDLCLASARLWPEFAAGLADRSGLPVGFDPAASLAVALDADEAQKLARIAGRLAEANVAHTRLTPTDVRTLEPAISDQAVAGMELPTDFRVHNRLTVEALLAVLRAHPKVAFVSGPAPLKSEGGRVVLKGHDAVLAAAGWQTASIKVEEHGQLFSLVNWDVGLDDIDCHGGQILSVAAVEGAPKRVVRSGHVYLVPRAGEIVIGATVEPDRILDAPEPQVIETLRLEGVRLCPELAEAPVTESWAGVRPGTPDEAPFICETVTPGLFVATGHYRNGILLAPVTARMIADIIFGVGARDISGAFSTRRAYAATA
ncbi:MAG: FAD-dependent oxidoreductase [Hyphomonas sp.]